MTWVHDQLASKMQFPNERACQTQWHQAAGLRIRERRRKLLVSSFTIHL